MVPVSTLNLNNFFFSFTITTLVTMFTVKHLEKISNIFYDFLTKYPGVGSISSSNNSLVMNTEIGELTLPLFKLKSLDIDIYFFTEQQIEENIVLKDYVFDELLKEVESFNMKRYGTSLIKNISRPSDFKQKNQISGFVRSFLEDKVLVFTIKDDKIIDYNKLINEFIDSNYEEDDEEEDGDFHNVKKLIDELSKNKQLS